MPTDAPGKPFARKPQMGSDLGSAFDVWLKRGLQEIYGAVMKEPISPELLDMIENDRKKQQE